MARGGYEGNSQIRATEKHYVFQSVARATRSIARVSESDAPDKAHKKTDKQRSALSLAEIELFRTGRTHAQSIRR
jgi:hypothetical protein